MAKKKKKNQTKNNSNKSALGTVMQFEIGGILLCAFAIISLANLGKVSITGRIVSSFLMGDWGFMFLIGLFALGVYFIIKQRVPDLLSRRLIGIYLIISAILLWIHIFSIANYMIPYDDSHRSVLLQTWKHFWKNMLEQNSNLDMGGGIIGAILYASFHFLFDTAGSKIFALVMIIIGLILLTGWSFRELMRKFSTPFRYCFALINKNVKSDWETFFSDKNNAESPTDSDSKSATLEKSEALVGTQNEPPDIKITNFADQIKPVSEEIEAMNLVAKREQEVENLQYTLPPLSLLQTAKKTDQRSAMTVINRNAKKLEDTLLSFGVRAKVAQIHLGPAVTQYEVAPESGVKVSRIVALADDIALALAAKDIRIEAPIPGKSAVGIEVPNKVVSMVSLKEVLVNNPPESSTSLLNFALGRDISGVPICADLTKMPHLLVAGSTGSGKSVCINGIITSILMRAKPHEVKMMMIDPKMVELNVYNGIPHLLAPVVTNPKRAAVALQKIVSEMERRYELFSASNTRNIEGYNEMVRKFNLENATDKRSFLPFIVVLVDELADLMMVASSEVEDAIMRLAQMARAAGIHLIIATQRPSVDVITGIIKANIPSRIAFAVSSSIDSRTILDTGGAEKLLGRGDMLFFPIGASKPKRVQGAFLSDQEVANIVEHVISQQQAQYQSEMIIDETDIASSKKEDKAVDELYEEAKALVIEMNTASVSLLQRRFRIGYSRAARLIDEMEQNGVVGPYEGSKPRKVLNTKN